LRSIQCILQATHGVVGPKREFFEAAFGKNIKEFRKLLIMPDQYIIYRTDYKNNGAKEWRRLFNSLTLNQRDDFLTIVNKNHFENDIPSKYSKVNALLEHYKKALFSARRPVRRLKGTKGDVLK
jgi:hypothetical protein